MLYEVGLLGPDLGPKNQAYAEDLLEEHIPIGGVIPLEEGVLLEALPVAPLVAPMEAPLEAPAEYSSLQLVNKILQDNRTSPELEELRIMAQAESDIWTLQDGLLLRHGRLYVTDDEMVPGLPLRTALIREAHDNPLSGHPGRAKLR